jgi:hypothetical protein
MKRSNAVLILAACIAAAGCRDRSSNLQRQQQQYDVVQEGSANGGVTSTLAAPGEAPPQTTPTGLTATNADTTTAFTLPGVATTTDTMEQPGTLGATLPPPPSPRPRPATPPRPEPAQTTTTSTPQPAPPATDTSSSPSSMPPRNTEGPPTDEKGDNEDDLEQQEQPALQPVPQPPPPPPTDTRGQAARALQ